MYSTVCNVCNVSNVCNVCIVCNVMYVMYAMIHYVFFTITAVTNVYTICQIFRSMAYHCSYHKYPKLLSLVITYHQYLLSGVEKMYLFKTIVIVHHELLEQLQLIISHCGPVSLSLTIKYCC